MARPAAAWLALLVVGGGVLAGLKLCPCTRLAYRALHDPYVAVWYYVLLKWLITSSGPSALRGILGATPLLQAGRVSYGLYVYHPACLDWVDRTLRGWSAPWRLGGGCLLTFGVAWLSYTLVEKRFLAAKRFFEAPASGSGERTPAAAR